MSQMIDTFSEFLSGEEEKEEEEKICRVIELRDKSTVGDLIYDQDFMEALLEAFPYFLETYLSVKKIKE